ncbi:MAG: HD-GYP domain-containing protein [Proteobacteria bacterium]|nr:MAG: HD-GYP domain-containing protein [Pseudomonadota bacterium]
MDRFKKTRVSVTDLAVGMYVCELDRPWLDLPFEPPFQIEGFEIRSQRDIDQVRRYCDYVFIRHDASWRDDDQNLASASGVGWSSLRSFSNSIVRSLFCRRETRSPAPDERVDKPSGKNERWEQYSVRQLSAAAYERLFSETGKPLPKHYEILSPNAMNRVVYQDQTSIEEELEPATNAIDSANSVYDDLVLEIKKEEEIDVDVLKETVDSMARSVIRNPDALSYLVHLKVFSPHTYSLAISSCVMAMAFGRFLGLAEHEIHTLGVGALLQDVGMVKLPPELLRKKGALNSVERKIVRSHVWNSTEIVRAATGIPEPVADICLYHHERYDGSGYPEGLRKDQIPLFATITGIVDTYMALISYRPYRRTSTSFEALTELARLKDEEFLGALVDRFTRYVAIFPVGSFVKLNSGHIGVVVARNPMKILEPRVMLIVDPSGRRMSKPLNINFAAERKSSFLEGLKIVGEVIPRDLGLNVEEFFAS